MFRPKRQKLQKHTMIPPPYPFPERWSQAFAAREAISRNGATSPWLTPYTDTRALIRQPFQAPTAPPPQFYHPPHATYAPNDHADEHPASYDVVDHSEGSEGEDGEYEYGYVLSDEWRDHLIKSLALADQSDASVESSSIDSRQVQRQRKPSKARARTNAVRSKQRSATRTPSQLDLALDEARVLERQRRADRHLGGSAEAGVHASSGLYPEVEDRHAISRSRSGLRSSGSSPVEASIQRINQMESALDALFEEFCDGHDPAVWPQGAS